MPDAIDTRLATYASHLSTIEIPAVRRMAPARRSPRVSIALALAILSLFSLGELAAAKYLLPVSSDEVRLSAALAKGSHRPITVKRFIQIDRVDQLRDGALLRIARRMSSMARLSDIRESVSGSDVDYAGVMPGGGRFYIMLWKNAERADDANGFVLADTHGAEAKSFTPFSSPNVAGSVIDLGGLSETARNALVRVAKDQQP